MRIVVLVVSLHVGGLVNMLSCHDFTDTFHFKSACKRTEW